jgi:hypothetical protein
MDVRTVQPERHANGLAKGHANWTHHRLGIHWIDVVVAFLAEAKAIEQGNPDGAHHHKRYQLLASAEYIATRRAFCGTQLANAAPWLVDTCGICGAKALYRYGIVGRCKMHRDDRRSASIGEREARRDRIAKAAQGVRNAHKFNRHVNT